MKTIQVQTDDSIIQKLKNAFTSPATVLSEAMQNARRAGASFVRVRYLDEDAISIEDNGKGISDLADFLTLAGSGWDEDVIEREGAFGMGSFSMLYYCDRIKVESNGKGFEADTADILQHKAVNIVESSVTEGTKIQLFGYEISDENNASRIEQELKRLAMAFPISVFYDDNELERPHRLDIPSINYISTPVGEVFVAEYDFDVSKLNVEAYPINYGSHDTQLYFQGLPIGRSSRYSSKNVVHVNENFNVRMPDRDQFISHQDVVSRIEREITALWHKKLDEVRAAVGDEVFAISMAKSVRSWNYKHIFNEMDVLPADVVFSISRKPVQGLYDGRQSYIEECKGLTRSVLEQPDVHVIKIQDHYDSDSMAIEQYAYHLGAYCVDPKSLKLLDESHWLRDIIQQFDEEDITVETFGPKTGSVFNGYCSLHYQPCEYYQLSGPLGSMDIRDECFAISDDDLIIPCEAEDGTDLLLAADYSEEYGGYDDNAADEDVAQFSAILTLLNTSREQGIINMLKRANLNQVGVSNKQLVVTFDADGNPCEVKESEHSEAA
jgi:hypothetical protein